MRYSFLFLLILSAGPGAYSQKVKGTITSSDGKPLAFASVYTKGTNKGTNANNEGKYSLKLEPGNYTLVCQHVGYKKEEVELKVDATDQEINFILKLQEVTLSEAIIKSGEDPAYQIIRNAIKKRIFYRDNPSQFECRVYTKGQLKLRDHPKKIFGQKVDFEDGDTSKKKMLYLSETISVYTVSRPGKAKTEVISSKVSGESDGFGLSAPNIVSFYDDNISMGSNLNPRGFISPISENALHYYKYKLEGSFFEDSNLISRIKVTPRRKYEPLFSGYISIVEDDWRIHSVQLQLLKESQMEFLDTLRIEQLYRPVDRNNWFISTQVIYPSVKMFGFDAYGSFVNVYSDIDIQPAFAKKTFTNTILKYNDSANKRSLEYWEKIRPVPLLEDEVRDYKKKDSLELARKDPRYLDSLDRKRNKVTVPGLLLFGQSFSNEKRRSSISVPSLLDQLSFNPAEGWVISTGFSWAKRLDTSGSGRRSIRISPVLRYGFSNKHVNPYLTFIYSFGKKYASSFLLSGGKRVFQFNNNSPIGEKGNSISSLLSEENRIKSYEATYVRGSFRKGIGDGFSWVLGFQYQDRKPLDNTTDYTWRNKADKAYTPNYPNEIMTHNIARHKVFFALFGISFQPGARYIELPGRKMNIGSKYPVFGLSYTRSFKNFLGTDADFSKWKFTIRDDINLKLAGTFRYRIGVGGFINSDKVYVPDFNHFNGNISTLATEYLNSFQLLPIYQFSNTAKFYSLAHVEHNFKGFLTNKIPGMKKLNLYLVAGANGFYYKGTDYFEWFVDLDNIFKQLRVDFVQSYLKGKPWQNGVRIGLSRLGGRRGDDWP
ncbi:MAG TPA: DUF5686 and carboxypeptidase regulatory-like domain-containing protein [Chitinophagaceae bacterium]|nr:DUF5686 and carboxypeptidase regulatory-like domain-containing protein [Chitinophagaceae bacterium]